MEWKQPEGIRRHWVLEEYDGELLFLNVPAGAAQGRLGDELYNLRDGGVLRKKRTIASRNTILAALEESASGVSGILHTQGQQYRWRPANLTGNRWVLEDSDRQLQFAFVFKQGLGKIARIEIGEGTGDGLGCLLLLCWYVTVL